MTQEFNADEVEAMFEEVEQNLAFLKVVIHGSEGSGKTYTAAEMAVGMAKKIIEENKDTEVFFADTESGAGWVLDLFTTAGIKVRRSRSRAFSDLIPFIRLAQARGGILLIDSITHFGQELEKKFTKNDGSITLQSRGVIKQLWSEVSNWFVNARCHIICCGRLSYKWSWETDEETHKKNLVAVGTKVDHAASLGYEPSLLIEMRLLEASPNDKNAESHRVALVKKDRSRELDGKQFIDPTFETWLPHINKINLGGKHLGIDDSRDSSALVPKYHDGPDKAKMIDVCLEEIGIEMNRAHPGATAAAKMARQELRETLTGSPAEAHMSMQTLETLQNWRNELWKITRGHGYDQKGDALKADMQQQANELF